MRGKILPKERQQLKEPFECDGAPCAGSNSSFKSTQLLFKLAKDPVMKYTLVDVLGEVLLEFFHDLIKSCCSIIFSRN